MPFLQRIIDIEVLHAQDVLVDVELAQIPRITVYISVAKSDNKTNGPYHGPQRLDGSSRSYHGPNSLRDTGRQ